MPPPAPRIAGVDVPAVTVPTPPPVAPAAPSPPPSVPNDQSVTVSFPPGATEITLDTQNALRALALRRGAAPLAAVGYGDATGGDTPAAQAAALPLAMARARAIAAVLMASGVPSSLVQIDARAEGHGGRHGSSTDTDGLLRPSVSARGAGGAAARKTKKFIPARLPSPTGLTTGVPV